MTPQERDFGGAKIVLHCEGALLTYLRDDKSGIPFPGLWDLPGGGREGDETPQDCALRETFEEFGLTLAKDRITWGRFYPSSLHPKTVNWLYAAQISQNNIQTISFGDEGQFWRMIPMQTFITHPKAVPHLRGQVKDFLTQEV
jgi:8-oxo-dGTP diphosphatase